MYLLRLCVDSSRNPCLFWLLLYIPHLLFIWLSYMILGPLAPLFCPIIPLCSGVWSPILCVAVGGLPHLTCCLSERDVVGACNGILWDPSWHAPEMGGGENSRSHFRHVQGSQGRNRFGNFESCGKLLPAVQTNLVMVDG